MSQFQVGHIAPRQAIIQCQVHKQQQQWQMYLVSIVCELENSLVQCP